MPGHKQHAWRCQLERASYSGEPCCRVGMEFHKALHFRAGIISIAEKSLRSVHHLRVFVTSADSGSRQYWEDMARGVLSGHQIVVKPPRAVEKSTWREQEWKDTLVSPDPGIRLVETLKNNHRGEPSPRSVRGVSVAGRGKLQYHLGCHYYM